jgi:uncharacterized protein YoxC
MAIVSLAAWTVLHRTQQTPLIDAVRTSTVNLTHLTRDLIDVCRSYQRESVSKLKSGKNILDAAGPVRLEANRVHVWQVKNEVTGELKAIPIPLMTIGQAQLIPIPDFNQTAPLVDEIAKIEGTPATIFERLNEQGDMLRICSSMKALTGARAIGTYIPGNASENESARAAQEVLSGGTYLGKEVQAEVSYLTVYQPLKDAAGKVVGMLSTALPEDQIRNRVSHLAATSANVDHGELFILEAAGARRGTALVVGDKSIEGSVLWDQRDPSGRPFVQELCSRALKLADGEIAEYRYQKPASVGGIPKTVIAHFGYVPELDWVVGIAHPDVDAFAGMPPMQSLTAWEIWLLFGVGVATTGLSVRLWIRFSDDVAGKLDAVFLHLRKEAKELTQAAFELSKEAEQAVAEKAAVTGFPGSAEEMLRKAGRTIEEIQLTLQHIDASAESVVGLMTAIDQITFATNLLMVNAAIQSASPNGVDSIADVANELRFLADRCRTAARTAKEEIEQSRAELERGNREVLQIVNELRSGEQSQTQPPRETTSTLLEQAETLLHLAKGLDHTVEVIAIEMTEPSVQRPHLLDR